MINSYKENFSSPLGAYAYLVLNQQFPQLFCVSSGNALQERNSNTYQKLEDVLCKETSLDKIIEKINKLDENILFDTSECKDTKFKVIQSLKNIKYVQLEGWESVQASLDYNSFSQYIADKEPLIEKLKEMKKSYSLNSMSLNLLSEPEAFIEDFAKGVNSMCQALDILPKQIGLNKLNVNFATEEGDFTGYVNYDFATSDRQSMSDLYIKKLAVFAHEWCHFLESSIGFKSYNYTELLDNISKEDLNTMFPEFNELSKFKETINNKYKEKTTENNFENAIKDASHFLHKYAIDKDNFNENVQEIARKFKDNSDKDELKNAIKELLKSNHPPRYFSFIEAQCDLELKKISKKHSINQIVDFSNKADEYLKESNYTSSTIELFARSFETYVHTKM